MQKVFIFSTVINADLWIVGAAMQIGGWVNQAVAIFLLVIAFIWTSASVIYYFKKRNRQTESLKEYLDRQNARQKWILFGVRIAIPTVIIATLVIYPSIMLYNTTHHPLLSFTQPMEISVSNDDVKLIASGKILFYIENVGNNTAYQIRSRVCYAPNTQPTNIRPSTDVTTTNPLQPHDKITFPIDLQMPYMKSGNDRIVESDNFYFYYRLEYSNAPNRGQQSDEYWLIFNFTNKTLGELTPSEKEAWEPFVYAFYKNFVGE
jgi:amino acid transporter